MIADTALFFGLWLRKALQIAAICPSGAPVASAMARLIEPAWPGPVLELGAGTGTIPRGQVAAGWSPERIIACERESQLFDVLRREVPGVTPLLADATDLEAQLRRLEVDRLAAVVSSLPIKWFSLAAQRGIAPLHRAFGPRPPVPPADKRLRIAPAEPPARHRGPR